MKDMSGSNITHTRMQTPNIPAFVCGNGTFQEPLTESVYQGQTKYPSNGTEYYAPFNQIPHDGIQKEPEKKVWYMVLNMTHPSLQLTWR